MMTQLHECTAAATGASAIVSLGHTMPVTAPVSVAPAPETTPAECEQLFLTHLTMIHRLIGAIARQHRLSADDAEEFAGVAQLRLISDDYAVLRKFRGASTLRTFLTIVIERMMLDYKAAQWGKWRPSVRSRRAGEVAVLLERLTVRDGLSFDEACSVLESNQALSVNRDTLTQLHAQFRPRQRPRRITDDVLDSVPAVRTADDTLRAREHETSMIHATRSLAAMLAAMPAEDRLLLKMRFADGIRVADIARTLSLDQKRLYRRLERLVVQLRRALEARGVSACEVLPAIGRGHGHPAAVFVEC